MERQIGSLVVFVTVLLFLACSDGRYSGQKSKQNAGEKPTFEQQMHAFSYTPATPVNPEKFTVIVVGSAGLDEFTINADKNDNWELIEAKYGETGIIAGKATKQQLLDSVSQKVNRYLKEGIPERNIAIVMSSSAIQSQIAKDFIVDLSRRFSIMTKIVTEIEEGQFAYRAVIPREFQEEAFIVDIGSGNTKISWLENGEIVSVDGPGSRYHLDNLTDAHITSQFAAMTASVPVESRTYCFLIGGAAFEISSSTDKYNERYTVLDSLSSYDLPSKRAQGGLAILKGIEQGTGTSNFIFDWESNFGIGYILSQN